MKRVLVIIDNKEKADYCSMILENNKIQYECVTSSSGDNKKYNFNVADSDYQRAIVLLSRKFYYDEDIIWIAEPYKPLMYGYLPLVGAENIKELLENYHKSLEEFCGTSNIYAAYETLSEIITFLYSGNEPHKLMLDRCKGFNYVYEANPFVKVLQPSVDKGGDVDIEKRRNKFCTMIFTYCSRSLFEGIISGHLTMVIPNHFKLYSKDDEGVEVFFRTGYNGSIGSYEMSFKDYNQLRVSQDIIMMIKVQKSTYGTDVGTIITDLHYNSKEVTFDVSLKINRGVCDKHLNNHILTINSFDEQNGYIKYTEHFKMISGGTRLLHYTDICDLFEVIDLPSGWKIEDGIYKSGLMIGDFRIKSFNDEEYDNDDKDLPEIYDILASRKRGYVKGLTKGTGK